MKQGKPIKWYTDGTVEVQVIVGEEPPEGFHPGRKIKGKSTGPFTAERRKHISEACTGRTAHNKGKKEEIKHIYYTDGKTSVRIPITEEPPCGFVRGRLKKPLSAAKKEAFNQKISNTKQQRYGDSTYNNIGQGRATKLERYGNPGYNNIEQTKQTNLQKYGVTCQFLRGGFTSHSSDSKPNLKILNYLQTFVSDIEREFVIKGELFRYDFKVGDTLIEVSPWPFHNSTFNPMPGKPPKDPQYHYMKTQAALNNNLRCLTIWEWDSVEKVLDLLKQRPSVGARQCVIKEVEKEEAKDFLQRHHLQGYARDSVRVGLYYTGQLIALMTFGKPRYNKSVQFELVRYCAIYNVMGGAQRLFKWFTDNYQPLSVVSYCDLSKFSGKLYLQLGFSLKKTSIGRHWYNPKTQKHITDNLLRQHGFDRLLGKEYGCFGKGTSNEDLMRQHGFVEIYDAGQATYIWKSTM